MQTLDTKCIQKLILKVIIYARSCAILDLQESFALFRLHEAIFVRLALGSALEITMFVFVFYGLWCLHGNVHDD